MQFALVLILLLVPACLMLAFGFILTLRSKKHGLGYPACGGCSYDLTGSMGSATRCPECGASLADVGVLPAQTSRSKGMFLVGVLLMILPVSCAGFMVLALMPVRTTYMVPARPSAAATNAQLQKQADAAKAQRTEAAAKLQQVREQLEASRIMGEQERAELERSRQELQKLLEEAERLRLRSMEPAASQPSQSAEPEPVTRPDAADNT